MTALNKTRWLIGLIAVLQVADVLSTNMALRFPSVSEANPLMAYAQAHLGGQWWLAKVAAMALMALLFLRFGKPRPAFIAAMAWVLVVGNNMLTLVFP